MTSTQLLREISLIDEKYIWEAAPAPRRKKSRLIWLRPAAAACLCATLAGLLLWQAVKPVKASAFEIEDGVLLAYTGTDTEVIIPDEVTKIAASTFDAAPSPECITSLHIGPNVEEVEENALLPLTELDRITISEENQFFEVVDGVLARKDGTLIFASIESGKGWSADRVLVEVMRKIKRGELPFSTVSRIIVGGAVIEIDMEESPYGPLFYATSITVYGRTTVFSEHDFSLNENEVDRLQAFELEDFFVISRVDNFGIGKTYILTEEESFVISSPYGYDPLLDYHIDPSTSIISFYTDGETLFYERVPEKYLPCQPGVELWYCVSRTELYCETGSVSLNEGELIFRPIEKKRVCDVFDLDELWEKYGMHYGADPADPDKFTLDDYLAKNAKKHKEADCDLQIQADRQKGEQND